MENENVNVNISVNNKGGAGGILLSYGELRTELTNSEKWLSDVAMTYKTDTGIIKARLEEFIALQNVAHPGVRDLDDFRKHFVNWLRKNPQSSIMNTKEYTYKQMCDMATAGEVKWEDYEVQPNKLWRHK